MNGAEARIKLALRAGEFDGVTRFLYAVDQHDLENRYTERVKVLKDWMAWKQPVEVVSTPAASDVVLYRVDLRGGREQRLDNSREGRFRVKPGSYVATVKKRGYVTARVPFLLRWPATPPVAGQTERVEVKLILRNKDIEGMVHVPAGRFIMGGASAVRGGRRRTVHLPDFLIDRTEVTGDAFKVFLDRLVRENHALAEIYRPRFKLYDTSPEALERSKKEWGENRKDPWRSENWTVAWIANGDGTWSPPKGWGERPVGGVCFEAARTYAASIGKRLPTSQEWEKAARGVDGRKYPWGNQFEESRAGTSRHPLYAKPERQMWAITFAADSLSEGASPYGESTGAVPRSTRYRCSAAPPSTTRNLRITTAPSVSAA
jgi:formylglycine-generating enzyme required for sulfatase activity